MKSPYNVGDKAPIRYTKANLQCQEQTTSYWALLGQKGPINSRKISQATAKSIGYCLQPHAKALLLKTLRA